jgi:deoxyribodipyrimidine photo-lyase
MKKTKRILVWFQQDLRLHDNEALHRALERGEEVVPVYVFDPRIWQGQTFLGIRRMERYRAQFILESVADLRQNLRNMGIDLILRVGKPEDVLFELAQQLKTGWIFANRERTYEEAKIQGRLERKLWSIGQELHLFRGKMLYHTQDLPFPVSQTPDVFTQFRKEIERGVTVRQPFPKPKAFAAWSFSLEAGELPKLSDFGLAPVEKDPRAVLDFVGGETAALQRLQYYFWESRLIETYEETRNGLIGGDYSSKFSPWLAQGCLSPKTIYWELKRYEKEVRANKSTYWLYFELLWRDFFRLVGKKYGAKIFLKGGLQGKESKRLKDDQKAFERWAKGQTGQPFIDANMRELNQTGFMSNRGRQNVASYLVNDLNVNWQWGAAYFEAMLLDYDVCSNWANWNYVAGVGNDPRDERYFNPQTQAKRYDPNGQYVKLWLPEYEEKEEKDLFYREKS